MGGYQKFVIALILLSAMITAATSSEQYARAVPAGEILEKIKMGSPVEYDNVVIQGDLNLSRLDLPIMHVDRSLKDVKDLGLSESSLIVNSSIRIRDSKIDGALTLKNASFQEPVDFRNVEFNGSVNFFGSIFGQTADFSGSDFKGKADFYSSQFLKDADFSGAQFKNDVEFSGAQFLEIAFFTNSIFDYYANFEFSKFNKCLFNGVKFIATADFLQVHSSGGIDFQGGVFGSGTRFQDARFNDVAYFRNCQFRGPANFMAAQFSKGTSFSNSNFHGSAQFQGCEFNGIVYLDGVAFDRSSTLFLNKAKYDKLYIRWDAIPNFDYDDTAYLLLIENFRNLGFFSDANKCYFQYRIESRQDLVWYYKPIDFMLMALYGYGTRPEYPLAWAILVILISGIVFFKTTDFKISFGEAILLSATAFTSGASSFITSPTDFTPKGRSRYIITLERISGWMLFALFLTALANTIIR